MFKKGGKIKVQVSLSPSEGGAVPALDAMPRVPWLPWRGSNTVTHTLTFTYIYSFGHTGGNSGFSILLKDTLTQDRRGKGFIHQPSSLLYYLSHSHSWQQTQFLMRLLCHWVLWRIFTSTLLYFTRETVSFRACLRCPVYPSLWLDAISVTWCKFPTNAV